MDSRDENSVSQPDDAAPQDCPASPQPSTSEDNYSEVQYLREQLAQVRHNANQLLAERAETWATQRQTLCDTIQQLKSDLKRLEGIMEDRDKEFTAVYEEDDEDVETSESEIFYLKRRLQAEMDRVVSIQSLKDQELERMLVTVEAEKQTALEQNTEMLALKQENQRHVVLQRQLQAKVEQLEEMLEKQSGDLLDLKRKNERLLCGCNAAAPDTRNSGSEFDDAWRARYSALQEQLFVDLPLRTRRWKTTIRKLRKELDKGQREESETRKREQQEKDILAVQLKEAMDQLKNTMAKHQETNKAWQNKYEALQDKFIQELVDTEERKRATTEEQQKNVKEQKEKKKRRDREAKDGKKKRDRREKTVKKKAREEEKKVEKKVEKKEKEAGKKVKPEGKPRGFFPWWN